MKTMAYLRWADPPPWRGALACCLPLWLLSLTFLPAETGLAEWRGAAGMLAIAVGIALLVVRWFTAELVLYSFLPPIILSATFDEMSPSYEAPFILFCALLLSAGIIGYRLSLHKGAVGPGWVILSVFFIGTWILAAHANQNYWDISSALGYGCEEGARDRAILSGGVPWWRIFFGV